MVDDSKPKDTSRECGKGETIRRGANIQKFVDNYDRIFRKPAKRAKKSK